MSLGIVSKLVLAFVTLILGVVLIGTIATQGLLVTDYTTATSEVHNVLPTIATGRNDSDVNATITYTLTNNPAGWKSTDCPITSFVLANSSADEFTLTTDYLLDSDAGTFTLVNSATVIAGLPIANNNTYATYNYCGDDYLNLGWGRTIVNLIGGFFALAILGASLGLFYSVAKETGML